MTIRQVEHKPNPVLKFLFVYGLTSAALMCSWLIEGFLDGQDQSVRFWDDFPLLLAEVFVATETIALILACHVTYSRHTRPLLQFTRQRLTTARVLIGASGVLSIGLLIALLVCLRTGHEAMALRLGRPFVASTCLPFSLVIAARSAFYPHTLLPLFRATHGKSTGVGPRGGSLNE